ncbi:hypothetical protein [Gelria sp. Kuro-4]|uniref:hypothetical protein n=1 Tax=Gelria sp. Kuro-4 TaxID=2796927 RepID=UPI001BEF5E12|nr:hypothetical protein [Gelria sp. Kuro-4]BCV23280.1 hypothetical protein kuro4_00530 [Gelria sp. Kuro-4]
MRFRLNLIAEYEPQPEAYSEDIRDDPKKMLEEDLEFLKDALFDFNFMTYKVRGEVISED